MRSRLIDLLACPQCGSDVVLEGQRPSEEVIDEGTLRCVGGSHTYPITNGVPRMTIEDDPSSIGKSFESEFSFHVDADADMDPYELRRYFFFARTGIDPYLYGQVPGSVYRTSLPENAYTPNPAFLEGKVVLDAGCGPGRFTEVAAREGAAYVVGLELGAHVDRAANRCRSLENADFVQASIFRPPFKRRAFDFVFSLGVLHHTPDPRKGFETLANLVKFSGAMSAMLYSAEYWARSIRGTIARVIHRWMSTKSMGVTRWVATRILYPLGKLQMGIAERRSLKWLFAPLFLVTVPRHPSREVMIATILDYYTPRFISTHDPEEVADWAIRAGFKNVSILPVDASIFAHEKQEVSI